MKIYAIISKFYDHDDNVATYSNNVTTDADIELILMKDGHRWEIWATDWNNIGIEAQGRKRIIELLKKLLEQGKIIYIERRDIVTEYHVEGKIIILANKPFRATRTIFSGRDSATFGPIVHEYEEEIEAEQYSWSKIIKELFN